MTQRDALGHLTPAELTALQSAAMNAAAFAIAITDRDSRIEWVNPAFTQLTGYTLDEAYGSRAIDLLVSGANDDALVGEMLDRVWHGEIWRGEVNNRRKDGSLFTVSQTIAPVHDEAGTTTHLVSMKHDVTEQRSLQAQFLQAQKMEVVGRLASTVAHDFNNLLTVISGTAELALDDLPPVHPIRDELERIREAAVSATTLTRQLLTFCRKGTPHLESLCVRDALRGSERILRRLIGEDIDLVVTDDSGDALINADIGQFEQVVLNLAINARDAMPLGGTLRINASVVDLDRRCAESHPGSTTGRHLRIEVSDTGCGMTPEVKARIFEPFFTTKETDKGTGLGLTTVYSIVHQSGGTISVSSAPGLGTTFVIYLPLVGSLSEACA